MKKVIVFDFDGTLTKSGQNVWQMLWNKCGYTTDKDSLYSKLYTQHVIKKQISREEWFKQTCDALKATGMTKQDLTEVTKNIQLLHGLEKLIVTLRKKGYSLYIVSGGIKECIEDSLGNLAYYFIHIEANSCKFDSNGHLTELIPTPYDYEGKADFIEKLKNLGYAPKDIIFVGNGDNDEWVHQTGCTTICINPQNTDHTDNKKWHRAFKSVTDITDLMSATKEIEENNK